MKKRRRDRRDRDRRGACPGDQQRHDVLGLEYHECPPLAAGPLPGLCVRIPLQQTSVAAADTHKWLRPAGVLMLRPAGVRLYESGFAVRSREPPIRRFGGSRPVGGTQLLVGGQDMSTYTVVNCAGLT